MGIPSYFSHIVKKYKKTIKSLESVEEHFDNLFMDCNSIIYDALRKLESFDNVELAKKVEQGNATLEELEAFAMKEGNEPVQKSAKQEYFEMVLNQYM